MSVSVAPSPWDMVMRESWAIRWMPGERNSCSAVKRATDCGPGTVASVSTVPGPQSVALFTAEQEFLSPGIQRIAQLSRMTMSHGEGATLTDIDGNRYIDFYAGVTVASLGHAHPELVAALEAQIRKVIVGSFTTENRAQLLELI